MVKLHHHKPEFCLSSADTTPAYKITFVDAILCVKMIKFSSSVFNAIKQFLMIKTHSTPLRELLLKYLQCQEDYAFLGEIQKHIAICMLCNEPDSSRNISKWRRVSIQATETQI